MTSDPVRPLAALPCPICGTQCERMKVYRCGRCGLASIYCKCEQPIETLRPIAAPAREPSAARIEQEDYEQRALSPSHVMLSQESADRNQVAAEPAPVAGPWEVRYIAGGHHVIENRDAGRGIGMFTSDEADAVRDALNALASRLAVEQPSPKEKS